MTFKEAVQFILNRYLEIRLKKFVADHRSSLFYLEIIQDEKLFFLKLLHTQSVIVFKIIGHRMDRSFFVFYVNLCHEGTIMREEFIDPVLNHEKK